MSECFSGIDGYIKTRQRRNEGGEGVFFEVLSDDREYRVPHPLFRGGILIYIVTGAPRHFCHAFGISLHESRRRDPLFRGRFLRRGIILPED